jgi:serine phosphatase RsbU (regulator of sigma subunit)
MTPMPDAPLPFGMEKSSPRPDRQDPYTCLHFVMLFVRNQERSLRFFVDQLGFRLIVDQPLPNGMRWIEVAPPDGNASLALAQAQAGSDVYNHIGGDTRIYFITENVPAKYEEWSKRGVHFDSPPRQPEWGGIFARFEDIDGNSFGLAGFDELTAGVEAKRRRLEEKLEAERRAAQELEIAKQVQSRLFPQVHPAAKTLDYAGQCLQARQVGGDYFDFLDLGHNRLGLVVGDVSGKGIAAALLMANLQANLRSQYGNALEHPELFLKSVNRLFYNNSVESAYASLFFAEYCDNTRRLRYANCGHLAGLVLRNDGRLERLESTATLLGLFEDWHCSLGECELSPGDVFALYTDGVTESSDDEGRELGEQYLAELLRQHRDLSSQALLSAIVDNIRRFNSREQYDDITLIVAKCQLGE